MMTRQRTRPWMALAAVWTLVGISAASLRADATDAFALQQGDHVCIVGNTLAERLQHDGWLETYLQIRSPGRDVVIRNLGYSGDELTLRLRSAGFGTPDEHLTFSKADVVLAFFGYNESFGGAEGLGKFKDDLASWIQHTLAQKYNGESSPRLVIFSPIAHEDLDDPNLPDGSENNKRLAMYTEAMAQVARDSGVTFVDLFHPSLAAYERIAEPLTINGIHLNEVGNRYLAQIIDAGLYGEPLAESADEGFLELVRDAVKEKNFYWYNRYRTVDGYSTYGGRADLKFVDDQTNRVVMQRELEILDELTAKRDEKIWATVARKPFTLNDDDTLPFIPVKTNKPGQGPGGTHLFLSGEESIEQMTVGEGMAVNLVADEAMFPELINPVQTAFDTKGRLWVAVWPSYPHWVPKEEMNDKLLIVEDDDGDGRADRIKEFAGGLHNPTGFEFWGGGVIVANCPQLLFLKDTDGDDKADVRISLVSGLDTADTHHASNSFTLDPLGGLYMQEGTFHHTQVESPYGPPRRCANAGVFRYEPRTQRFEIYVTHPFANPHGHAFDRWGQDFIYDGTGSQPYHAALFSGHLDFPAKHATPPRVYQQRTRPCPGVEFVSGNHFPPEMQGNLLVGNVIGFQGILQYKFRDQGASFGADEVEPMLSSKDPSFRPTDLEIGPDGALWFTDWQNPIIGHMQHNLRDPSRDRKHGRIYRVTYKGRPLDQPKSMAGLPIDELLDLLKDPGDRVRYRTRIELSGRPTQEVMPALDAWIKSLDPADPEYAHHLLESLWLRANHNVVDVELLDQVLGLKDFRARAAATRVMSFWADRVPGAIDRLTRLAADEHPRVRLEAVRAASFFPVSDAVVIPLTAAMKPQDEYIEFVYKETMRALEPYWKKAMNEGQDIAHGNDAAMSILLKSFSNNDLMKLTPSRTVLRELISRPGIRDEVRGETLGRLASIEGRSELDALVDVIASLATGESAGDDSVLFDLGRILFSKSADELKSVRPALAKLASDSNRATAQQMALAAMMTADGTVDSVWQSSLSEVADLRAVISAMPFLKNPALRSALFAKVRPLLEKLPKETAEDESSADQRARYVRVELPGKGTLTLAEVEVYENGRNVARDGVASQINVAYGGEPKRGIDGNTSGKYLDAGQTHTAENTDSPWWEVDLGRDAIVNSVVIHNRQEGKISNRLDGFSLILLDAHRDVVARRDQLPAPMPVSTFEFSLGDAAQRIRWSAMSALTAVPGMEGEAFAAIAPYVDSPADRAAATDAILRIPVSAWSKTLAEPLATTTIAYLRSLPASQRTTPTSLNAIQFGESLATLLPADRAQSIRKEIKELGVNLIRVATVPDRMLYDQEVLVAEAGKPVEILFENTDIMPHNFVITQPGALTEVGELAEAMATQPEAVQKQYVPDSPKVIVSSRLLQPRQVDRIQFQAPKQPGVYPFVCTYPGHWRRMYGAMYVVADLDAYRAEPARYLASQKIEPVDPLLKFSRPRTEWKLDELTEALADLDHGRTLARGQQAFLVANCVACHRMNGIGYEVGPDLSKLDEKQTPATILKSLLEPSAEIKKEYATQIFELVSGQVVTGLVVEESAESVTVVENPLAKSEPIVIAKSEIDFRQASPTSAMPVGILDRLTREEILDLVAYLVSRGDAKAPIYHNGTGHGGH